MRIPAVLALLPLVSACARDLDIPVEPPDVPERLGELSGLYSMSIVETVEGVALPVELPVSAQILVLNLDKPGGEVQPLVAVISDSIVDLVPGLPSSPGDETAL